MYAKVINGLHGFILPTSVGAIEPPSSRQMDGFTLADGHEPAKECMHTRS